MGTELNLTDFEFIMLLLAKSSFGFMIVAIHASEHNQHEHTLLIFIFLFFGISFNSKQLNRYDPSPPPSPPLLSHLSNVSAHVWYCLICRLHACGVHVIYYLFRAFWCLCACSDTLSAQYVVVRWICVCFRHTNNAENWKCLFLLFLLVFFVLSYF